jgi:hypothetical protein
MSTSAYDLDAHYCVFNIELTNKQRAALQWYLTVPYGGYTYVYDSQENGLKQFDTESSGYTWIKFRPTSSMDVLAKYKDKTVTPQLDDTNLRSLDDLKLVEDGVMKYPWTDGTTTDDDPTSTTPHPYTVFIDEYVYHSDPKDPTISDEDQNEWLWGKYVNQENRKVDLYDESMYPSTDQESYYIPAIYTFSQRSIQTHYADDAQKESAFGSEHINENYGLNFDNSNNGSTTNCYNGRYILWDQLFQNNNSKDWNTWVDYTAPGDIPYAKNTTWNYVEVPEKLYPVPMLVPGWSNRSARTCDINSSATKMYRTGMGCMNRNRDEDGDGKISTEELKWYVPASEEYIQLAIGQTELPSPLIRFSEHSKAEFLTTETNDDKDRRSQLKYHYWTSDGRYFFAEEGMSFGEGSFNYWGAPQTYCYEVRCIRQLGKNPQDAPANGTEFGYSSSFKKVESDDKIYIESTYFTNTSIRPSTPSYLAPHDISSPTSMPSRKFEVAKDVCYNITADDGTIKVNEKGYLTPLSADFASEKRWYDSCAKNSICSKYTQEADGADKGTWRVPNIRELAMMKTCGLAGGTDADATYHSDKKGGFYLSCTHDYFNYPNYMEGYQWRFFGKRGDDGMLARNMMISAQLGPDDAIHVKCVRDVISESDNEVNTGNE